MATREPLGDRKVKRVEIDRRSSQLRQAQSPKRPRLSAPEHASPLAQKEGVRREGGGRTGNVHAAHPPVDVHLVTSNNGLPHTLAHGFLLCCILILTAPYLLTAPAVPTISWCLLDRRNEPSNQSRRDPGLHVVIDGTCQVARQCLWRCFMLERMQTNARCGIYCILQRVRCIQYIQYISNIY